MRKIVFALSSIYVIAQFVAACDGASNFGGKGQNEKSAVESDTEGKPKASDSEIDVAPAIEAVAITGAYLSCAYLSSPQNAPSGSEEPIACALLKGGKNIRVSASTLSLKYSDELGNDTVVAAEAAAADSAWTLQAQVKSSWHAKGSYTLSVPDGANMATFKTDTADMAGVRMTLTDMRFSDATGALVFAGTFGANFKTGEIGQFIHPDDKALLLESPSLKLPSGLRVPNGVYNHMALCLSRWRQQSSPAPLPNA